MNNTGFWIIVGSPENFERTRALGFTVQGLKSRHRKKAEMMKPGDKFAYYLTGRKAFAAIATVISGYRAEHDRIWASGDPARADEDYPFRLDIEPDVVLDPDEYIDAEPIARQMDYASKWPAANWTLAFQGNVHSISETDFGLIEAAMKVAAHG